MCVSVSVRARKMSFDSCNKKRDEGREGGRWGGREGGRWEEGREGGKEGGRKGGRKGGREERREGVIGDERREWGKKLMRVVNKRTREWKWEEWISER